ncbi:hypothetical protein OQA88_6098 [Cercophora sp. LCS_1]
MLAGALFLGGLPTASGAIHNLFVGNLFTPANIHALEFNDETHAFKLVQTHPADASHAWISFDHAKRNIYGVSLNAPRISSYHVTSPTSLTLTRNSTASGACTNKTSAFIQAMPSPPYHVFSASWPASSCGMSLSVDWNGTLDKVLGTWTYPNGSGVHGLAFGEVRGETVMYSADLNGDSVWTHLVDKDTGAVEEVGRLKVMEGSHPRHLTVRSKAARYLYVLMEADNSVGMFDLDAATGMAVTEVERFSLVPDGVNNTLYWSAEVMLSKSEKYLWATARAKRGSSESGWISAFLLADDGRVVKRMFMIPTSTVGGWANAISPAGFSDEYAAMTDYPTGYVEMFKMEGGVETEDGLVYETARSVGKVEIADGGCCANVIWYS